MREKTPVILDLGEGASILWVRGFAITSFLNSAVGEAWGVNPTLGIVVTSLPRTKPSSSGFTFSSGGTTFSSSNSSFSIPPTTFAIPTPVTFAISEAPARETASTFLSGVIISTLGECKNFIFSKLSQETLSSACFTSSSSPSFPS